jgi:acyl dehydratase
VVFDLTLIGRWSAEYEYTVAVERVTAYAAATNDDNPMHRQGVVAPPVFACVPTLECMMKAIGTFVPPEIRSRSVHSRQEMLLYRPIVPGMVLYSRAVVTSLGPVRAGTEVTLKTQSRDVAGHLVNEGSSTLFLRGVTGAPEAGDPVPGYRAPADLRRAEPIASVPAFIDEDQTFRYAAASGDHSPIHLDAAYARSVGLPGIIVHGLCTMAIASAAIVERACNGDSSRLRRLAVRFARPVLPGQQITTQIYAPDGPEGRRYHFTVLNAAGKAVIQDGLADVS